MLFNTPQFWRHKNLLARCLWPFSWLYYLGHKLNQFLQHPIQFKKKIICVGNIIAGGAGKTPVAIALAKSLQQRGIKVAFAYKNYQASNDLAQQVSSNSNVGEFTDEAILLSNIAPCFVARQRIDAINLAQQSDCQIIIVDDGLQDRKVDYDVKIAVCDATIGFGNGYLLPAGPLRDRITSLAQVDYIFQIGGKIDTIKQLTPYQDKIVLMNINYPNKPDINQRYVAFAGLAYPEKFFNGLKKLNLTIVKELTFPDHYLYSSADLQYLQKIATENNSILITTEKDYVRIKKPFALECLKMELKFETQAIIEEIDVKTR